MMAVTLSIPCFNLWLRMTLLAFIECRRMRVLSRPCLSVALRRTQYSSPPIHILEGLTATAIHNRRGLLGFSVSRRTYNDEKVAPFLHFPGQGDACFVARISPENLIRGALAVRDRCSSSVPRSFLNRAVRIMPRKMLKNPSNVSRILVLVQLRFQNY